MLLVLLLLVEVTIDFPSNLEYNLGMDKINWKDVYVSSAFLLSMSGPTIRDLFRVGDYRAILFEIERIKRVKNNPSPVMNLHDKDGNRVNVKDVDFGGMTSVFQLLTTDAENGTGYFDLVNPIRPEEVNL